MDGNASNQASKGAPRGGAAALVATASVVALGALAPASAIAAKQTPVPSKSGPAKQALIEKALDGGNRSDPRDLNFFPATAFPCTQSIKPIRYE